MILLYGNACAVEAKYSQIKCLAVLSIRENNSQNQMSHQFDTHFLR